MQSLAEVAAALRFANELHAADPAWVPALVPLVARRAWDWVRRGSLDLMVSERDGRIVGTISVLRDREFEIDKGERVAWFGYFDVIDDVTVAEQLIAAARARAREWGAAWLRGPRDLTRFENVGLTVEGHALLPPFLCRHHPPRYQALLEGAGFVRHHDVLAYETPLAVDGRMRELPDGLRDKARAVDLPGLTVRAARRRTMGRDLIAAHEVLNASFRTVPDVAPMPRAMFLAVGRPYLLLADPRLLQLAELGGRPVGIAGCFPELNEALVRMGGRAGPLGWWSLARGLRRVRTASFKLIGVLPELRGTGLHAKLIENVIGGAQAAGYERLEASVIDERNGPMRAVVEHAGMTIYRRYRFYETPAG